MTNVCRTVALALFLAAVAFVTQGQQIRVTLLGTGCPPPAMNRFGPSTLVEAGEQKFLFDAGRGALQRLTELAVRWQDVQGVFLTHLHSDHVVGFPDLWLTGWLIVPGRNVPLRVWGPRGTGAMMSHLKQAYEYDVRIRVQNDGAPPQGAQLLVEDIREGVVYEKSGVKITAFEVDHAPVKPAFGYRIDYAGHSVVLSGDTRVSENLVRHAQGVDVLVHEVFAPATLERAGVPPGRAKRIVGYHTTPEQAGEVFSRVKPKLAVFSHICMPSATEQDLLPATRKTYAGPLELGEDLMAIDVGETIAVRKQSHPSQAVSPVASLTGSVDSVVDFLLTAAATDFHTHRPPYPGLFRDVRLGHVTTPSGEKQYRLCGQFLPAQDGGKAEWTAFATIKTSGYEQWIGGQVADFCQGSSFIWDNVGDLSSSLQSRLDSLR